MSKKEKMLTTVFRDRSNATRAYEWLQTQGFSTNDINVLMSDRTRETYESRGTEGKIKHGDKSTAGVAAGGAIGTAVGATLGAIAALGTSVAVPGLGMIVAGPILAAFAGGGAGAVTGGLMGGLIGLGIPESNALAYEEALKSGGIVFGVAPPNGKSAKALEEYFRKNGGENIVYAQRA